MIRRQRRAQCPGASQSVCKGRQPPKTVAADWTQLACKLTINVKLSKPSNPLISFSTHPLCLGRSVGSYRRFLSLLFGFINFIINYFSLLFALGALNVELALKVHSVKISGPTSNSLVCHLSVMMSSSAQYSKAPPRGLLKYQKHAEDM